MLEESDTTTRYWRSDMFSTNSSQTFQVPTPAEGILYLPSSLAGFTQHSYSVHQDISMTHTVFKCSGSLSDLTDEERICPECGSKMHIKSSRQQTIRHLPFGSSYSQVSYKTSRLYCEKCGHSHMRSVPFKAGNHRITLPLKQMVEDMLATGWFTNKQIAELTGLGQQTVAQIDRARLRSLSVEQTDEGPKLRKPDTHARFLAIDEFKLHNGHQYATYIIDLETGHVLWIARGKKKQAVYDIIDHVGLEWMKHVQAVACDMNSDFQEAFQERCDWISIVFVSKL